MVFFNKHSVGEIIIIAFQCLPRFESYDFRTLKTLPVRVVFSGFGQFNLSSIARRHRAALGIWRIFKMLKQRIAGLLLALISAGIFYQTWSEAQHGGHYLKAVALSPVGIIAGIFIVFFPQFYGKPETAGAKAVVFVVFAIGLMLGLGNLYLFDPQMFKF